MQAGGRIGLFQFSRRPSLPSHREVLPCTSDAWCLPNKVKAGYETSFTRHFYKPKPILTLEEAWADILALYQEMEELLGEIVGV